MTMTKPYPISVVLPTYNGLDLLQRHLPSVMVYSGADDIIIVDDASSDDTVSWLKAHYPQVNIIANRRNQGFADSVNLGFTRAKNNLVLLLNNDVSLEKHTVYHLLSHFSNPDVFAVGAQEILPDGSTRGRSTGSFQRGLFVHTSITPSLPGPTMWVFAASGLFNKSLWRQLNGLDPLFKPAYWEDIDIGYRAWKAGFICLYEPKAKLYHQVESTMTKHLGAQKSTIAFRNQLLFFWKNITSPSLIVNHILWLPYHLTLTTIRSRGAFLLGFIKALFMLTQIRRPPSCLLTDQQVILKASTNEPT